MHLDVWRDWERQGLAVLNEHSRDSQDGMSLDYRRAVSRCHCPPKTSPQQPTGAHRMGLVSSNNAVLVYDSCANPCVVREISFQPAVL